MIFLDDNSIIVNNNDEIELLEFNERIKFNINIRNILKENKIVYNNIYHLNSIIYTPNYDHYTSIIFNPPQENNILSNDFKYYYDSLNGYIEKIINNSFNFETFNPYIGLYILN